MTATTLKVRPFQPQEATPAQRLSVGQLLCDCYQFTYPDDPPQIPEVEAEALTFLSPDERSEQFVVWEGPQAIGWGRLSFDLKQNTHAAHANLNVHPQHRRQGIGRAIALELQRVARREQRRLITFGTSSQAPAGEAFARHWHAEPALPMKQSRLDVHQVDATLLTRWQQRPASDPYRLLAWQVIPDGYLPRAAEMMMVMNTAPRGDLDVEDWQITPEMIRAWEDMIARSRETRFFLAAEHLPSGELHGYTETYWSAERAALVYQGATAVRPEARGQGLGKWLKAAMLEHLRQHCPGARWIRTNNANVNEAMLGINVAMGFVPWATFTEWQLKLPE